MVALLVRLKLTLLKNSLKRSVWRTVGMIIAMVYALVVVIVVLAGLIGLRFTSLALTADLTVVGYAGLTVGWLLMSMLVFTGASQLMGGSRTWSWPSASASPPRRASGACARWSAPGSSAATTPTSDPAAVGRGLEVTVHVELTLKDRATVEAFETGIAALDEVIECRRMFGLPDYVIRVAVADQAAYEAFYMNELAELPGLARVNSQFTMKMVKRGGTLPV